MLLDLMMPGLAGEEVLKRLEGIPVIVERISSWNAAPTPMTISLGSVLLTAFGYPA